MKCSTILIILLAVGAFMFLLPASMKCRLYFWDKDACTKVQQASQLFGKLTGETIDPNAVPITQYDEALRGLQKVAQA